MKKDQLIQYSTMAVSFILINEVEAQAVYTDIDPDTIINIDGEHGYIDMDNDGVTDFRFFKFNGTELTYWSDYYYYLTYLFAAPELIENAIAGQEVVINPSYGGFIRDYPFALEYGDIINNTIDFYNVDFQVLAFKIDGDYTPGESGGKWYPSQTDRYLGVRFLGGDGCNHYGWIRCDVKNGADTLIIKDYAYESKCDVGILAGDIIGDTATVNIEDVNNSLDALIYSYDKRIFIQLKEIQQETAVKIYDLAGKEIFSAKIQHLNSSITLNEPSGIYFVEVQQLEKKLSKQIFIR